MAKMQKLDLDTIRARLISANKTIALGSVPCKNIPYRVISASLSDIPDLLNEVKRLREALKGAMVIAKEAKRCVAENERLRKERDAAVNYAWDVCERLLYPYSRDEACNVTDCPLYDLRSPQEGAQNE